MKKSFIFALLFLTTLGVLTACKSNKSEKKVSLNLSKSQITTVDALKGTATKGATVVFIRKDKNDASRSLPISAIKTKQKAAYDKVEVGDYGEFQDEQLISGEYYVYATLNGEYSKIQKLTVTDYHQDKSESKRVASQSESQSISESKDASETKAWSSVSASIKRENREYSQTHKSETKSTSDDSAYKKISLTSFTENPYKYDGKNIKTSGTVIYIQKNPDDHNVYYVAIVPLDKHTSSGISEGHGTVAEINIDTMNSTDFYEGDQITVEGGGLVDEVTLHGKTIQSAIVVDNVSVN